jgi:hypothetical protein
MIGLLEYFQLWDMMQDILLSQEDDQHSWRLEGSGQFTLLHLNHGGECGRPGLLESARYSCGWPSAAGVGW